MFMLVAIKIVKVNRKAVGIYFNPPLAAGWKIKINSKFESDCRKKLKNILSNINLAFISGKL